MTRILHVTDATHAGVLVAVTDLAREQAAVPGTSVTFAYTPRPESPDLARIRDLTGPDVRVHRLTAHPRCTVPALLLRLAGAMSRENPDVIHLHSSRAGFVGRAVALAIGRRRQVVYSPHGFAFERAVSSERVRALYTMLERLAARMAPALALCSASEQRLAQLRVPRARTAVLPNAVDVDRLRQLALRARPAGSNDGPLTIVHVGRISEQKLVATFGRIAERWARESSTPARFVWIGDGDRSLLPPHVTSTGWLDRDELLRTLATADLMLFTSAAEAMPMSLLEAQAMGIPVVASRVTGVVDVIDEPSTGFLGSDEDELYEALARLAESPELRCETAEAAVARAKDLFDLPSLAERSFAVYAALGITPPSTEGRR